MTEKSKQTLEEGVVAGLIGFATVAVVFAVSNLAAGRSPFYTPALLGATLFYGIDDPNRVVVEPSYVFAYNGAHLVVFLALGLLSAWLAAIAERGAQLWYVAIFVFILGAFHIIGGAQALAVPVQAMLSAPAIWAAGLGAAVAMGSYILWAHPVLRRQLRHWEESEL